MIKTALFLALVFCSTSLIGQTNYEQFKDLYGKGDTIRMATLLQQWARATPEDPELYTSQFNYYYVRSKHEGILLDPKQQSGNTLVVKDSTGKVVGYISEQVDFDTRLTDSAFLCIDLGIRKFPDRLDMRFGKCYLLSEMGRFDKLTVELIDIVNYSKTNHCNWYWMDNEKLDSAQGFMLGTIHNYLTRLYSAEDDAMLQQIKQIGDVTLRVYPDCIEILSMNAVANIILKDYDAALGYLQRAEKLDPHDFIVLGNLAQAYLRKGDKPNAIKYFQLTQTYGDEDAKKEAAEYLKKLKS